MSDIGWLSHELHERDREHRVETADLRTLIAVLVEKLGGRCSISHRSFLGARNLRLSSWDDARNRSFHLEVDGGDQPVQSEPTFFGGVEERHRWLLVELESLRKLCGQLRTMGEPVEAVMPIVEERVSVLYRLLGGWIGESQSIGRRDEEL